MTTTLAELRALLTDPWIHLFLAGAGVLAVAGALTTSPAFLSGLVLAVGAGVVAARDLHEGTVADTLTRVPDRAQFLLGRIAAPALLTAAGTVVLTLLTLALGASISAAAVEGPAVVLLTAQATCLGLLTQRPALAAPAVLALWFVTPTALRAVGVYLGAADALSWPFPVGLAADAAGWSPVTGEDQPAWGEAVRGALGLIAWTAALLTVTWAWLKSHDFGRTP